MTTTLSLRTLNARASMNPGKSFIGKNAPNARQAKNTPKARVQTLRHKLEEQRAGMKKVIRGDLEDIARDDVAFAMDVVAAVDDIAKGFVADLCPETRDTVSQDKLDKLDV